MKNSEKSRLKWSLFSIPSTRKEFVMDRSPKTVTLAPCSDAMAGRGARHEPHQVQELAAVERHALDLFGGDEFPS